MPVDRWFDPLIPHPTGSLAAVIPTILELLMYPRALYESCCFESYRET